LSSIVYLFVYNPNLPLGMQVDMVDQTESQKITGCMGAVVADGNKNCNNIVSDQDRMPVTDNAVVTCQSNSKNLDKLRTILASKELSDAALTVVLSKRDRLVQLFSFKILYPFLHQSCQKNNHIHNHQISG
jgi:hypothetical protein